MELFFSTITFYVFTISSFEFHQVQQTVLTSSLMMTSPQFHWTQHTRLSRLGQCWSLTK